MNLDMLKYMMKPQAAPETVGLRRMRFAWMGLCILVVVVVPLIRPIADLFGNAGVLAVLVLLVATGLHGLVYFKKKNAADEAYFPESEE